MVQIDVSTPHLSELNRTIGLLAQFKSRCRETRGSAVWKQTLKKRDTVGDSWRELLRIRGAGGIMSAAYAPAGATNKRAAYNSSQTRTNATN